MTKVIFVAPGVFLAVIPGFREGIRRPTEPRLFFGEEWLTAVDKFQEQRRRISPNRSDVILIHLLRQACVVLQR
jgi:hypothetical protein